ncbi:fam-a protein [Plasmodium vinckei brucechwatti]|uniref:Fam-a protein n=1 Tax=Plasmodium vinckei brucechwatti TaxID=119398 RepID=A0A6V7S8B5_PLAVN|nr:fam-a protein [Plasmodium vinckei brucechwatti]
MKAIPLGLIYSIIFSIVLAQNSSDSESTTGCFPFCRKKTKKSRKTTDEPVKEDKPFDPDLPNLRFIDEFDPIILEVYKGRQSMLNEPFISETDGTTVDKVTGFLRRENESIKKGWYIRPYEENYEHMIKVNFIPLKDNYQYNQKNVHKQGGAPPPVPKAPGKQEFPEEPKLSAINEDDACVLNEDAKLDEVESFLEDEGNYKIYEKSNHLLCTDPEEIKQAEKLMNEAVTHLEHHATSEDGYKRVGKDHRYNVVFYEKKHQGHTDVEKTQYSVPGSNKYNKIINELWNHDIFIFSFKDVVKRKIVRVYNPNLVIIRQRYKKWFECRQKYFYALAKKTKISKDKTIIVMTSANINDHHPSKKEYKNTIIESANLFKIDIDSNKSIRNGRWKKIFVNIAGFLIEKKDEFVYITYIRSIDEHDSI